MNLTLFISALTLLFSCKSYSENTNSADEKGTQNTVTHKVSSFNGIDLSTVLNINLVASNEEKVEITTDENYQQYILVNVSNGTLFLKMKENVSIKNNFNGKITIYYKTLDNIHNRNVGNLKSENTITTKTFTYTNKAVGSTNLYLEVENLKLENSAVGSLTLKGKSKNFEANNKAVGPLDAKDFSTDYLILNNKAVGSASFTVNIESSIVNKAVGGLNLYGSGTLKSIEDKSIGRFTKH